MNYLHFILIGFAYLLGIPILFLGIYLIYLGLRSDNNEE